MKAVPAASVRLCDIVKAEPYYGVEHSRRREANLQELEAFFATLHSLPFDGTAAKHYGRIRAELAASGTIIGPNDLLIAAIAVAGGHVLVTHNTSEFSRVRSLVVEDWQRDD